MSSRPSYILGLDIGTTSIKLALIDQANGELVQVNSRDLSANVHSIENSWSMQDVSRIFSALHLLMSNLEKEKRISIQHIILCGQMHGLVLWRSSEGFQRTKFGRIDPKECSNLITWQDRRCSTDFLNSLPRPRSGPNLASGFGNSTLFWYARNDPETLDKFDCAGTVVDFITAALIESESSTLSVQMASSWGYFDIPSKSWDRDSLEAAGFPVRLLPQVVDPGDRIGSLKTSWESIPIGVSVYAGLGDLQCSVYSYLKSSNCAALNVSTSAQMTFRVTLDQLAHHSELPSGLDVWPYFENEFLVVAASLNGGNVLARFVKMVQSWVHEVGANVPPESQMWSRLTQLASTAPDTDLHVVATLFGERHLPQQRASVENVRTQNLQLGSVYKALCRGVIHNLVDMMPPSLLKEWNKTQVVGSGSALTRNSILQDSLRAEFSEFDIEIISGRGACAGAASYLYDKLIVPINSSYES